MWLFVSFDLPVVEDIERKRANRFRKFLQNDGFSMHQYSVYIRHCGSKESADVHVKRVRKAVPPKGHVSILQVTDKQYSNIINIWGKGHEEMPPAPKQLEFF